MTERDVRLEDLAKRNAGVKEMVDQIEFAQSSDKASAPDQSIKSKAARVAEGVMIGLIVTAIVALLTFTASGLALPW